MQQHVNNDSVLVTREVLFIGPLVRVNFGFAGYSSLHRSAAWGHVGCLRVLVGCGAEHQLKTRHKETPRDIAARYGQTRCVEYLDCVGRSYSLYIGTATVCSYRAVSCPLVDATYQLTQAVKQARDTLSDTDRIAGKWGKDDKVCPHA